MLLLSATILGSWGTLNSIVMLVGALKRPPFRCGLKVAVCGIPCIIWTGVAPGSPPEAIFPRPNGNPVFQARGEGSREPGEFATPNGIAEPPRDALGGAKCLGTRRGYAGLFR